MRLNDISNAKGINVVSEPPREAARDTLAAHFTDRVAVHRVVVVGVLVEWEGVVVRVTLCEAHAVDGLRRGDDDFLNAELRGGFDYVVGGEGVDAEGLAVRHEQVARHGGEVDHYVGRSGGFSGFVAGEVEVRRQGVEDLAGVCQVCFEVEDIGEVGGDKIEVQDRVTFGSEVGYYMAAGFAATAGEDDAFW